MANGSKTVPYQPPVTVKAGKIQFVEACHPPLVAGEYVARMGQQIKESKDSSVPWNSDPYSSELTFSVDAPRFTLNPGDIHSVFPPVGEAGRFDNVLPHVVFTRRTLPWERKLDGIPPQLGEPFPPWLAILLFQEQDELPALDNEGEPRPLPIFSQKNESLLHTLAKDVLVPDVGQSGPGGSNDPDNVIRRQSWEKEQWRYQSEDKSCLVIDMPAALFKALAPRDNDLPYLAHVRQVDTGNKEVLGINDRGWFSLVIGNRLPEAKKSHRAFLVSLEGWQDCLKESWTPAANQKVRLAVLGSWAFTCLESNDFKSIMDCLNFGSQPPAADQRSALPESGLHLSYNLYDDTKSSAEDIVNAALARGYTAFDHALRNGEKTVSWYRGPLVPLSYHKPAQIQALTSCADELLRYDPDTGLFEVTYAAAWQLGRLLALQNQGFALALDRTRRALRAKAERMIREDELQSVRKEAGLAKEVFLEDSLMNNMAGDAGNKLIEAVPK